MTRYLLDANVFMEAKNRYYGFDFCPAFWDWLIEEHNNGRIFSVEMVGDELRAGNDELATWAVARGLSFFLAPNLDTPNALARVSSWVAGQDYNPSAISSFLQDPDYYLVSQALALDYCVVTHEKPENSKKIVKIPNPCNALGIRWLSPFKMLRDEQARFVLAQS